MNLSCPLCNSHNNKEKISATQNRTLYLCSECNLVFAHPLDLLSTSEEKARYNTHKNGIEYPGYVKFLMQAIDQAIP